MNNKVPAILSILVVIIGIYLITLVPVSTLKSDDPAGLGTSIKAHVIDTEEGRVLMSYGRVKGFVDTASWKSHMRYVSVMDLPMQFYINPGKMFLAGLGTGSIVNNYRRAGWEIDVAEEDYEAAGIAKKFFNLPFATIHPLNGRDFLEKHGGTYDIILVDAINSGNYPLRMMTREFFQIASSRLNRNGIFAISFESDGWYGEIVNSLSATLKLTFSEVFVFPITEPPSTFGSIMLFASNGRHDDLVRDVERNVTLNPEWRYGPEYQKAHAWDNHFVAEDENAAVCTDSDNPISRLRLKLMYIGGIQTINYIP